MKEQPILSRKRRIAFCSPSGLLIRAGLIVLLFVLVHLAGWRQHTTFISGTTSSADVSVNTTVTLGVIYLCAWFGCLLGAPILMLAAGLLKLWDCAAKNRGEE